MARRRVVAGCGCEYEIVIQELRDGTMGVGVNCYCSDECKEEGFEMDTELVEKVAVAAMSCLLELRMCAIHYGVCVN